MLSEMPYFPQFRPSRIILRFHRHCEEPSCPPKPAFGRRRMRRSNPSRCVRGCGLLRSPDGALRRRWLAMTVDDKITELVHEASQGEGGASAPADAQRCHAAFEVMRLQRMQ